MPNVGYLESLVLTKTLHCGERMRHPWLQMLRKIFNYFMFNDNDLPCCLGRFLIGVLDPTYLTQGGLAIYIIAWSSQTNDLI